MVSSELHADAMLGVCKKDQHAKWLTTNYTKHVRIKWSRVHPSVVCSRSLQPRAIFEFSINHIASATCLRHCATTLISFVLSTYHFAARARRQCRRTEKGAGRSYEELPTNLNRLIHLTMCAHHHVDETATLMACIVELICGLTVKQ